MHPVIRIICFLVFVICLSRANAGQLFLGLALLFLLYLYSPVDFLSRARVMLLRLRWFFLSILVLYFWMTPDSVGLTTSPALFSFIPPGIIAGLERIFSLVLVVAGVSYLLASLQQEQLIAAIYWLATPFSFTGLRRETLALRLVMGLNAVNELATSPRFEDDNNNGQSKSLYYRISSSMKYYYHYTLSCAEQDSQREYSFDCLLPPALWQWSFPVGLYVLFLLAGRSEWL